MPGCRSRIGQNNTEKQKKENACQSLAQQGRFNTVKYLALMMLTANETLDSPQRFGPNLFIYVFMARKGGFVCWQRHRLVGWRVSCWFRWNKNPHTLGLLTASLTMKKCNLWEVVGGPLGVETPQAARTPKNHREFSALGKDLGASEVWLGTNLRYTSRKKFAGAPRF